MARPLLAPYLDYGTAFELLQWLLHSVGRGKVGMSMVVHYLNFVLCTSNMAGDLKGAEKQEAHSRGGNHCLS